MAEQIEKVISVRVDGIEKTVVSFNTIEAKTKLIKDYLQETGKSLPEKRIQALAKSFAEAGASAAQMKKELDKVGDQIDKNNSKAKGWGRNMRGVFKNIGFDALGGGVAGLFGGFIGGGVATLVDKATSALYEWITAESDAQKAARELQEANDAAIESFAQEKVTLEVNTAILLDNTASTDDKKRALDELQELYPAYFDNLTVEELNVENVTKAYDDATASIHLKIKAQALESLATKKLTEIETAKLKTDGLQTAATDRQNQVNTTWLGTLVRIGEVAGLTANVTDVLTFANDENAKSIARNTEEYEKLLAQLEELEKKKKKDDDDKKKAEDAAKNASANAEKAEQRRKEAIKEGVTDLESAIRRLQEVQSTANEDEIEQAKELVRLYEQQAIEKINAANAVTGLTGRTEEELKDLVVKNKAALQEVENTYKAEGEFVRKFFKDQVDGITKTMDDAGRPLVKIFDVKGIELDINKFKGILTDLQNDSKDFVEFLQKAELAGFKFTTLRPIEDQLISLSKVLRADTEEITKLKKQREAAGFDIAEIQNKANEAILNAEDELIKREQEINKKRAEALAASPELTAKALELAGVANVEQLIANRKRVIEAEFEAAFVAEQKFIEEATAERNKVLGSAVIGGSADEGFFVTKEAREKALPEEVAQLEKLANDANNRLKLARQRYRRDLQNAEFDAIDQAFKNADIAAKAELRQLRADLKTKELEQDSYYDDVLESNRRFAERVVAQNGELGEQDINFIRSQKEQQIKLRQEALDLELKAESDRYVSIIAQLEKGSEAYLTVLQEFENKKLEIINKGQSDLKKIDLDFENIIMSTESKDKGIKNFNDFWAQAQPIIQNIAQAIDNIFQIIINQQQEVVNGIQERLSQVDTQLQETLSRISELEADLEGKRSGRREAILRGIQEEKEQEERLTAQKIALAQRLAREEEKLAKKRKAAAITQAIINGAVAITQLNASIVDPTPVQAFRIAANIALAAVIGTQIALIASQKFAEGGHTGSGRGGNRDETGHIPVGVVHNDEYVVPKWMVKSPKYRPIIDNLESARKRGFAEGGYTSPDYAALSDSVSPNSNNRVMSIVQRSVDAAIALSERPVIANPVEFTNVERTVARRVQATTIGG